MFCNLLVQGRIRPIEQYVAGVVSLFSENLIKTMSAEKTLLVALVCILSYRVDLWKEIIKRS